MAFAVVGHAVSRVGLLPGRVALGVVVPCALNASWAYVWVKSLTRGYRRPTHRQPSRGRYRRPCHQYMLFPEREAAAVPLASRAQETSRKHRALPTSCLPVRSPLLWVQFSDLCRILPMAFTSCRVARSVPICILRVGVVGLAKPSAGNVTKCRLLPKRRGKERRPLMSHAGLRSRMFLKRWLDQMEMESSCGSLCGLS